MARKAENWYSKSTQKTKKLKMTFNEGLKTLKIAQKEDSNNAKITEMAQKWLSKGSKC